MKIEKSTKKEDDEESKEDDILRQLEEGASDEDEDVIAAIFDNEDPEEIIIRKGIKLEGAGASAQNDDDGDDLMMQPQSVLVPAGKTTKNGAPITDKEFYKAMQKLKDRGNNAVPPKKSASAYILFGKEVRLMTFPHFCFHFHDYIDRVLF